MTGVGAVPRKRLYRLREWWQLASEKETGENGGSNRIMQNIGVLLAVRTGPFPRILGAGGFSMIKAKRERWMPIPYAFSNLDLPLPTLV
jgi:hypothetical protein